MKITKLSCKLQFISLVVENKIRFTRKQPAIHHCTMAIQHRAQSTDYISCKTVKITLESRAKVKRRELCGSRAAEKK